METGRRAGAPGERALVSVSTPSLWGLSVCSWRSRSGSVRIALSWALVARVVGGLHPESHVSGRLLGDSVGRGRVPSSPCAGAGHSATRGPSGGNPGSQRRDHSRYGLRAARFGGVVRGSDGISAG